METEINQNWTDSYCPICKHYGRDDDFECERCPLSIAGYNCNRPGVWRKMNKSGTWGTWLNHAIQMLEIIKGL